MSYLFEMVNMVFVMKRILFLSMFFFFFMACFSCNSETSNFSKLLGVWENDDQGYVQIYENIIEIWSGTKYNDTIFYSVVGVFENDENNIYITRMNYFASDSYMEKKSKQLVLSYKIINNSELILFTDGYLVSLRKTEALKNRKSRCSDLNGNWVKHVSETETIPIQLSLLVKGTSMLVSLQGTSFICEFLGIYECKNNKIVVEKRSSNESIFGEIDERIPDSENYEVFYDIYSYAKYFNLPEYVFLAANENTPYKGEISYELQNNELVLYTNSKKIVLERVPEPVF